jgi:hypothetical protein
MAIIATYIIIAYLLHAMHYAESLPFSPFPPSILTPT